MYRNLSVHSESKTTFKFRKKKKKKVCLIENNWKKLKNVDILLDKKNDCTTREEILRIYLKKYLNSKIFKENLSAATYLKTLNQ